MVKGLGGCEIISRAAVGPLTKQPDGTAKEKAKMEMLDARRQMDAWVASGPPFMWRGIKKPVDGDMVVL